MGTSLSAAPEPTDVVLKLPVIVPADLPTIAVRCVEK
jgi:hypothetical protein